MLAIPSRLKIILGCVTLLILISMLTYFNSLKGSFQFDDVPLLKSHWLINTDAFFNHPRSGQIGNRPVLYWTFALNNQLAQHQVFGFHLLNLALHIGVTLLIFFTIWRAGYLQNEHKWGFPLSAALLFTLHPLNTDTVSYISSRSSLLATFFYLLTLYIFLNLFSLNKNTSLIKRGFISLLVLLGIYLCVATKLIGATLPFILVVWYWSFIGRKQFPEFHQKTLNNKSFNIGLASAVVIIVGILLFKDSWIYIPLDQGFELFGRIPYLMVQLKVIVFYYLKLFCFPFNLNVDSGFSFSSPASDFTIIFSGLIILAIVLTTFKWKNIWVIAGTLWFFITLAPTSSFIPLNDLAVEHRMYLPMSLGLSLIAAVGITTFPALWRLRLLVVLLVSLGITTTTRNADWVSELSLWKDSAKKNPYSPRSHNNLGKTYYEKGNLALAAHHLEKSVANIPRFIDTQYNIKSAEEFLQRRKRITGTITNKNVNHSKPTGLMAELVEPHFNLASVYLDQGRLDDAEHEYQKTLALRPGHISSQIGLSSVYNKKGFFDQATKTLELMIKKNLSSKDPNLALARLNLGELYGKTRKIEKAITEWKAAIKINPSLLPAHFNLGTAYMMKGKLQLAESAFELCLKLNNHYEPALFNLAKVYQRQEKWAESTQQFKAFLEVAGPRPSAYTQMGFNLNRQSDWDNAKHFLEKSISLQPEDINTRITLAETFTNLAQIKKAHEHLTTALKMHPNPNQIEAINNMMLSLTSLKTTTP
ncbi:MAG: tetratricopeptide repeat protein [Nitrospina sp.]|jgi:protein O-mannosyl-transferase|nr:tetratricopeptide repeat protein [Nitrospina sp.]